MFSQPRIVMLLIFGGIVSIVAGFGLLLIPFLGTQSSMASIFLLTMGVAALLVAGCLSRK